MLDQFVYPDAKQKHLGCKKSARPIRSSIVNRYVQPKTLISVEAEKLLIKNRFNYLNDVQQFIVYFHNYDWLCHLATFIILMAQKRWPSDKANHSCENTL